MVVSITYTPTDGNRDLPVNDVHGAGSEPFPRIGAALIG